MNEKFKKVILIMSRDIFSDLKHEVYDKDADPGDRYWAFEQYMNVASTLVNGIKTFDDCLRELEKMTETDLEEIAIAFDECAAFGVDLIPEGFEVDIRVRRNIAEKELEDIDDTLEELYRKLYGQVVSEAKQMMSDYPGLTRMTKSSDESLEEFYEKLSTI
jgi:hypothetical protein